MPDQVTKTTTNIGFILLLLICVVAIGFAFFMIGFLVLSTGVPVFLKIVMITAIIGFGALVFSVARQRLLARKTDKYLDVEI